MERANSDSMAEPYSILGAGMKMPFYLCFVCIDAWRQLALNQTTWALPFSGPDVANASSIQFPQGCL